MNLQTIKVKFAASLITNITGAVISFFSGFILARLLGPGEYGVYSFLIGSFSFIFSLVDIGTSNAFFTFISAKKQPKRVWTWYLRWFGLSCMAVGLFVLFAPKVLFNGLWVNQPRNLVFITFFAIFFRYQLFWRLLGQIADASHNTVYFQVMRLLSNLFYLLGIIIMGVLGIMTVKNMMFFLILEFALLSFVTLIVLKRKKSIEYSGEQISEREAFNKYYAYCKPFLFFAAVACICDFGDKWLLQVFAGDAQQGFFGISSQFSLIALLATTAMMNIFWKEISETLENKNHAKANNLYGKTTGVLVFIAAVVAGFLIPWSKEITHVILGAEYLAAWPVMAVLFLFPVYQTVQQIGNTAALASGNAKIYVNVSIIMSFLSLILAYVSQAPKSMGGLGGGALILAIKVVLLGIVIANIMNITIAKKLNFNFCWKSQFICPALFIGLSLLAKAAIMPLPFSFGLKGDFFIKGGISFIVYAALSALLVYKLPKIAGLSSDELKHYMAKTLTILKFKK